jgi:nicotinamide-nucleotide amidase
MERLYAGIITIGDELLIGQVADTNSAWMAKELNKEGIWVRERLAVGDFREDIRNALDWMSYEVQIVLITGGLGPTADDITKDVLNEYFGGRLVVDRQTEEQIIYIFEKVLHRPLLERNLQQAEVPDNCTVLHNKRGTAPGMWFERNGKVYVSMPGVPHEMMGMMKELVLPALRSRFSMPAILHRTLLTAGIGESFLAEQIHDIEAALPDHIRLAYLPNYGMVRIRLTGTGPSRERLEIEMSNEFEKLKSRVSQWLVSDEDLSIQEALGMLLLSEGKTIGTAESCTGGYIAHLITSVPGSSRYYKGSVVSYSNDIKQQLLQVSPEILQQYGAVSAETVEQMAKSALTLLQTDFVVVTSGIMGPEGGSEEKPVGTAWIAVGDSGSVLSRKYFFRFDRLRNIELTSVSALNQLREFMQT